MIKQLKEQYIKLSPARKLFYLGTLLTGLSINQVYKDFTYDAREDLNQPAIIARDMRREISSKLDENPPSADLSALTSNYVAYVKAHPNALTELAQLRKRNLVKSKTGFIYFMGTTMGAFLSFAFSFIQGKENKDIRQYFS
ncbi:MAG: hypothetical protein AABW80_01355 [Nanoarchaeota archaeon]